MTQEERRKQHLEAINGLIGIKGYNAENWRETWDQLAALEAEAAEMATANASDRYAGGDWEKDRETMEKRVKALFERSANVIFNADPRGWALKIYGDYSKTPIFTDWGGNIPIAPEHF